MALTLEELLALPARMDLLETQMQALGAMHLHWQPVASETPVLALWTPELTVTETDLLRYIAAGWSNQQIADERAISERTVRTHTTNILGKLNLASRTEVALWALATGSVGLERAVRLMLQQQPHLALSSQPELRRDD